MAAWVTVTLDDIKAVGHPSVIAKAFDASDGSETMAWFRKLSASIIATIRVKIASCPSNVLDANENLIPPEWHHYATLLIHGRVLARVTSAAGAQSAFALSEDQKAELTKGREDLDEVAACKMAVSTPLNPQTEPDATVQDNGPSVELVTDDERQYTRETMQLL